MEYVRQEGRTAYREKASPLTIHRLTFWEGAMTVVGATIGSGVLGLAYASRDAGWPILILWLVVAGICSAISMAYVAEVSMRTKAPLQLSGLAEKYIGRVGSWLLFFAVGATSFCSLIAYTSGCGKILSEIFQISPELGSLLFIVPATAVVWLGLKATGVAEKFMSGGMVVLLFLLVGASLVSARVPMDDILYSHWAYAMPVFNIAVFCYAVQYVVPELARGMRHAPHQVMPSILTGMGISFAILALVPLSVFLILPVDEITEVASLAWGRALGHNVFFLVVNIFAFCAMMTSFWAIAESFLANMVDKFHLSPRRLSVSRVLSLIFIVVPPFLLAYSQMVGFVNALFWAGTFGGILMSVLPVVMIYKARKHGDQEPAWSCGWLAHPVVATIITAVFAGTGVYALISFLGI